MAVIHKMKDFALIKYKDQDSASRGMRYLNKVCLHGRKISIFFSKYVCIEERRFHNQKDYFYAENFALSKVPNKHHSKDRVLNPESYDQKEDELTVSKSILIDIKYASHRMHRLTRKDLYSIISETVRVNYNSIILLKNSSSQATCLLDLPTVSDALTSLMKIKIRLCTLRSIKVCFSQCKQELNTDLILKGTNTFANNY